MAGQPTFDGHNRRKPVASAAGFFHARVPNLSWTCLDLLGPVKRYEHLTGGAGGAG